MSYFKSKAGELAQTIWENPRKAGSPSWKEDTMEYIEEFLKVVAADAVHDSKIQDEIFDDLNTRDWSN